MNETMQPFNETHGPGNVHAPVNEVAGDIASGPRAGVAARELQRRAAKKKRQRGAEDAQNSNTVHSDWPSAVFQTLGMFM